MSPIKLGLFGPNGRLGERIQRALVDQTDLQLEAVIGRGDSGDFSTCEVVIDVAVAAATERLIACLGAGSAALVTGVTGRDAGQQQLIDTLASERPVFEAANFSMGVAVLVKLARDAARALGPQFDVEIFELHHRQKADAPSGTALRLGQAVAEGRALSWPEARAPVRDGLTGPRAPDQIGFAAGRGGQIIGEHTVFLCGPSERIELTHRASDRALFAQGALRAARWLCTADHERPAGKYGMADLLA